LGKQQEMQYQYYDELLVLLQFRVHEGRVGNIIYGKRMTIKNIKG